MKNYLVKLYIDNRYIRTERVRAENEDIASEMAWEKAEQLYSSECEEDTAQNYWEEYVKAMCEEYLDSTSDIKNFNEYEIRDIVDMIFNSDRFWESIDDNLYDLMRNYASTKERIMGGK